MASIGDHDLDDAAGRKQAPESMAGRARQSASMADIHCFCRYVGITAYEHCPLDCVQAKSSQVDSRLAGEQYEASPMLTSPHRAENNEQERQ